LQRSSRQQEIAAPTTPRPMKRRQKAPNILGKLLISMTLKAKTGKPARRARLMLQHSKTERHAASTAVAGDIHPQFRRNTEYP